MKTESEAVAAGAGNPLRPIAVCENGEGRPHTLAWALGTRRPWVLRGIKSVRHRRKLTTVLGSTEEGLGSPRRSVTPRWTGERRRHITWVRQTENLSRTAFIRQDSIEHDEVQ